MDLVLDAVRRNRALVVASCAAALASGLATTVAIHLITVRVNGRSGLSASGWVLTVTLFTSFLASLLAKATLNHLGARVISSLRQRMVRAVLSAPYAKVEALGEAKIYAALTEDLDALASTFELVPGLLCSVVLVSAGLGYLIYLSPTHFFVVGGIVGLAIVLSLGIKGRTDRLLHVIRRLKSDLFAVYESMLRGSKELRLSRQRRVHFYDHYTNEVAVPLQVHTIRANNWLSALEECAGLFAALAIVAIVSDLHFFGPLSSAAKSGYVITVLFIQAPIRTIFDGARGLQRGRVAATNIHNLGAFEAEPAVEATSATLEGAANASVLELRGMRYAYSRENADGSFALGPIDLTVRAGEILFIVGGNGSGKSTLAKVLTGLYSEHAGEIRLDGRRVPSENRDWYRDQFAAVFTDFHLFSQILSRDGRVPCDDVIRDHLRQLRMDRKVGVKNGRLLTGKLSTGQSKRLAFLLARMESKTFYLFDEWAAEQDPHFRDFFYEELLPELKRENKAIVCITHDARYFHVADRVVQMEDGVLTVMREDASRAATIEALFTHEVAQSTEASRPETV
jgi:putative pyoverdin transport system ATP-binding/permease protein